MVAPVIPALNDSEIERILEAAHSAGVREAGYVLLRLPLEVRDLFREWLRENYPDREKHVFKLVRDMRGGKDYDSKWFERQRGRGPYAASNGLARSLVSLRRARSSPPSTSAAPRRTPGN